MQNSRAPKSESQSRGCDITLGKRKKEERRNILGQVQVRISVCAQRVILRTLRYVGVGNTVIISILLQRYIISSSSHNLRKLKSREFEG